MPHKKEKVDKSLTLGELFELAGCPLTLPESNVNKSKRKRKNEKPIKVELAPGYEDWQPDPKVTRDIIFDAIERKAESLYKAIKESPTIKTGKELKKLTSEDIRMALLYDFECKLKKRLSTDH